MITLGITGGVGTGKSLVLQYINTKYNVKLICCDNIAKSGIEEDEEIRDKLNRELISYKIYDKHGIINKDRLADIIFNNKEKLRLVNKIVHPYVKNIVQREMTDSYNTDNYDGLIVEAALLLEEEYDSLFDCIYVHSDRKIREERLKVTRGYSADKIAAIMDNQLNEAIFQKRCKFTIDNNGDTENTYRQIDNILNLEYGLRRKDV